MILNRMAKLGPDDRCRIVLVFIPTPLSMQRKQFLTGMGKRRVANVVQKCGQSNEFSVIFQAGLVIGQFILENVARPLHNGIV